MIKLAKNIIEKPVALERKKKSEAIGHATPFLTQEYSHFLTSPILYGFLLLYGYGTNRNIGFVKL